MQTSQDGLQACRLNILSRSAFFSSLWTSPLGQAHIVTTNCENKGLEQKMVS